MKSQSFSNNANHRLILPVFQDIRLATDDTYLLSEERLIRLKGTEVGVAVVKNVRFFEWRHITEPAAWAITGKGGTPYLIKMYTRMYPNLKPDSRMALITWEWKKRDMTALSAMIEEYWMAQLNLAGKLADNEPVFV